MADTVLLVDDEAPILALYSRQLAGRYEVDTAADAEAALARLDGGGPCPVVVSDYQMPGTNGLQLVAAIKQRWPETVCMVLTGQADLDLVIEALNEGTLFRFMTKPCPPGDLERSVAAGFEQYRLQQAERDVLDRTLGGAVEILTEVLGLLNPTAFSSAQRIKKYVGHVVARLGLDDRWTYDQAALLSQLGCIGLPPNLLEKAYADMPLSDDERKQFAAHPKLGGELLAKIPRFEPVSRIIAGQAVPTAVDRLPDDLAAADPEALGTELLRAALEYDRQIVRGQSPQAARARLAARPRDYHPAIVAALEGLDVQVSTIDQLCAVTVDQLRASMVLDEDVHAANGVLLATRGQEVTLTVLRRLQGFAKGVGVVQPFRVRIPAASRATAGTAG